MCNTHNQCNTKNTRWDIRFIEDSKPQCVALLVEDNEDAFVVCDSFTEYFDNPQQASQFILNKHFKEVK